ncbi:hypothetical protein QFZ62_001664 [Clavibacter sp. B3I6]|uniref:hypothetical protein n=1 Tax=Clavibacter sp. B3I6 TaxID=3042268 RepID=UPI002787BCBE|nr:hypothetical protein [Clavibacter sp. B3I6]MDQ0744356.1 hypothetical protein [Clavibacter sp. B3I6]
MSMSEPLVPHDHPDDVEIAAADAGDGAPVATPVQPTREDVGSEDEGSEDAADGTTEGDVDPADGPVGRDSVLRRPTGERLAPEELAGESD